MAYAIPVEAYEEHLSCSICMDMFKDPRALPCLHTFCVCCLNSYICSQPWRPDGSRIPDGFECPMCRVHVLPPDLPPECWAQSFPPNYTVKALVEEALNEAAKQIDKRTDSQKAVGENKGTNERSSSVKCDNHASKDAEFFCKDHGRHCCSMCAALKHRKCKTLVFLGNLSDASEQSDDESAGTSADIGDVKDANAGANEHKVLSRLSRYQNQCIEQNGARRDSMEDLAKDFERALVIVGCTTGTTIYEDSSEEAECSEMVAGANGHEPSGVVSTPNVAQENEQHDCVTAALSNFSDGANGSAADATHLRTTSEHEPVVKHMEWSGSVREMMAFQSRAVQQGEYSVRVPEDMVPCSVTGIAALMDGRVLLADANNNQIKMFTHECEYITHMSMPWQPFGIVSISDNEVAVSFPKQKLIQIILISENSFVSGRVIELSKACFGVASYKQEIYVVLEDEIRIIDKTGATLTLIPKDKTKFVADPIFNNAQHIAVSPNSRNSTNIYVTDNIKGSLVCVNRTRKYVSFTEYKTGNPLGITATPDGSLFVCSSPRHLMQVNIVEKGALTKPVLELDRIQTVQVNGFDNRLWVASWYSDSVRLYECRSTASDAGIIIYKGEDKRIPYCLR